MNKLIYITIGIVIIALIILIIHHFFGKDYELSKEEEIDWRELDILEQANRSEYLFGYAKQDEYLKNKKDLIKVLDRIEKAHRYDYKKKKGK